MAILQKYFTSDEIAEYFSRTLRLLNAFAEEGISINDEEDPALLLLEISHKLDDDWSILFSDATPNKMNIT